LRSPNISIKSAKSVAIKKERPPSAESPAVVAGILLLAGRSSRMGFPKPLLPFGDQTLLTLLLDRIIKSDLARVNVVLGPKAEEIKKEIGKIKDSSKLSIIYNPDFKKGLSSSISAGLAQLDPQVSGVMFLMGDQPLLTTEVINRLIREFRKSSAPIIVPLYGKVPGNPAVFRSFLIPKLQKVTGDTGGRELIKKYWDQVRTVPIRHHRIGWDVDTWEDYQRVLKSFRPKNILHRKGPKGAEKTKFIVQASREKV
jgi:molybdenum cofactor cytidylyltransferase